MDSSQVWFGDVRAVFAGLTPAQLELNNIEGHNLKLVLDEHR